MQILNGIQGEKIDRIQTVVSSSTITPNADIEDGVDISDLAVNTTFAAPIGTPTNGQRLLFRIEDDGTIRTLTWNAIYFTNTISPPTETIVGKITTVGFIYSTVNGLNKWVCVSSDQTLNSLLPTQTGNNGKFLQTDGSNVSWQTASGGSGLTQPQVMARSLGC